MKIWNKIKLVLWKGVSLLIKGLLKLVIWATTGLMLAKQFADNKITDIVSRG